MEFVSMNKDLHASQVCKTQICMHTKASSTKPKPRTCTNRQVCMHTSTQVHLHLYMYVYTSLYEYGYTGFTNTNTQVRRNNQGLDAHVRV